MVALVLPSSAIRWGALVSIALLATWSPVGAASANETNRLQFQYGLGAIAEGNITGTLEATAYFFPPGTSNRVEFESAGGTLTHFVTEFNYTVLRPENERPQVYEVTRRQMHYVYPMPAGHGTLQWGDEGAARAFGFPGPLGDETSTFAVEFNASGARSDPVTQNTPHEYYVKKEGNAVEEAKGWNIYTFPGGVRGPNRFVQVENGTLDFHGDFTFYLEHARIRINEDINYDLPPRREIVTESAENPVAQLVTSRLHYAFLDLQDAQFTVVGEHVDVLGRSLAAQVHGTLTAAHASGTLMVGDRATTFAQKELAVSGAFSWSEEPATREASGGNSMSATVQGAFQAVGLDHDVAYNGPFPWSDIAKVSIWATLASATMVALYAMAKHAWVLFSRFHNNEAQRHPLRRALLDLIRQNPGLHVHALAGSANVGEGRARYHLEFLERHELVVSRRVGRERRFWLPNEQPRNPRDLSRKYDPSAALLSKATTNGRLRLETALRLLGRQLGLSRAGAYKAVRRAIRQNVVKEERERSEVWLSSG